MIVVRVDPASPVPPYEQLRAQIAAAVLAGELPEGYQLPPIRQLAADLDLAPGTVARAYRELETAGLVISSGRRGTRVGRPPPREAPVETERLAEAARAFAQTARAVDAEFDEALGAVHAALRGVLRRG